MPTYMVTDPNTGRKVKLTGDTPPTDADLDEIFASIAVEAPEKSLMDKANEAILSNPIGRGVSEFAAGVNRGATGLVDFVASLPNAALQVAGIDAQIPSLTKAIPQAAQGNFMEKGLGRDVVRAAGEVIPSSIAMGSALRSAAQPLIGQAGNANALPQLAAGSESVGAGALRQMAGSTLSQDAVMGGLSGAGSVAGGALGEKVGGDTGRQIGSMVGSVAAPVAAGVGAEGVRHALKSSKEQSIIKEAAPTIDALKDQARQVYKQIDDLGAVVDSSRITGLVRNLNSSIKSEGFNKRIHPKVAAALDEFNSVDGRNLAVSDLDTLRKVARSAAASIEPDESRLGSMMIEKIDDFMDSLTPEALVGGKPGEVGSLYKDARQLWGRARKAEDIEWIIEKARNQASGFENGLRSQFTSLLNNKKKIRGYSPDEVEAIQKVVRGGTLENTAKALGKFGFTEGRASSMLLGSLGVAGGSALGGNVGAVAVPLIGQVSKNLAQKMTRNNAEMVSRLVRSGRDSTGIANAYFSSVPAGQRSAEELTELLLKSGASGKINVRTNNPEIRRVISDSAYIMGALNSQKASEDDKQTD